MLSIGIFAMVLTAIYATWIAILRGSVAGMKAAAEVQRARIALRSLEDAFTSVEYFDANRNWYMFYADTSGDMASVSIAARLPAGFLGVGRYQDQVVRRVNFYTEPGANGTANLMMTQQPILMVSNSTSLPYTITLAKDVTFFKLNFYDAAKGEWLEEWTSTNMLPKLVEIALGLGKTSGNASKPHEIVYSLVAVPSVGVPVNAQVLRYGGQQSGQPPPGGVPPGGVPPGGIPPGGIPPGGVPPGGIPPGGTRFR